MAGNPVRPLPIPPADEDGLTLKSLLSQWLLGYT